MGARDLAVVRHISQLELPSHAGVVLEVAGESGKPPELAARHFAGHPLHALARAVVAHTGRPVSDYAVTAFLESRGWTDADAFEIFGMKDLVGLGSRIWELGQPLAVSHERSQALDTGKTVVVETKTRLRGTYFLALALIQMVGLVVAGIALGVGSGFSRGEATAAALGLVLGLVWANAFSQFLARDPLRLYLQAKPALAGKAALRLLLIAIGGATMVAALAVGLVAIRQGSLDLVLLGAMYFLLLSLFWLLVNALFVFEMAAFALATATLAVAVLVGIQVWAPDLLAAKLVPALGLLLAVTLMAVRLCWWCIQTLRQHPPSGRLSRLAAVAINQWGYGFYGLCVMLLIVLDRFVAWSVAAQGSGLSFQFGYEIALAWALLAFLLIMVYQERLLVRTLLDFRQSLLRSGQGPAGSTADRGPSFSQNYWQRLLRLAVFAAVICLLAMLLIERGESFSQPFRRLMPSQDMLPSFYGGLVGYAILALALLNTGFIIAMSQPGRLVIPLLLALGFDVVVAWNAASLFGISASVLGLVAGALLLLVLSTWQIKRLLVKPDHTIFASQQGS
ncbi:MAG: hypothetical protein GY759_20390 [Chloroflexi bacterium]|nr:hypothetical protein [Chloroflexota bacterium]